MGGSGSSGQGRQWWHWWGLWRQWQWQQQRQYDNNKMAIMTSTALERVAQHWQGGKGRQWMLILLNNCYILIYFISTLHHQALFHVNSVNVDAPTTNPTPQTSSTRCWKQTWSKARNVTCMLAVAWGCPWPIAYGISHGLARNLHVGQLLRSP